MPRTSSDRGAPHPGAGPHSRPREPLLPFDTSLPDLLCEPDATRRWERAFGAARPLRIEIGFGNSDFLLQVARAEPAFSYLGFEYSRKRVEKFVRRVEAERVDSIRV